MQDPVTVTVVAEHRNAYGTRELKAPKPAKDAEASYTLPRDMAEQLKAQGLISFDEPAPAEPPAVPEQPETE